MAVKYLNLEKMLSESKSPALYKHIIVQVLLLLFLIVCEAALAWLKAEIKFVSSDSIMTITVKTTQLFFLVIIISLFFYLIRIIFAHTFQPVRLTKDISDSDVKDIERTFFSQVFRIIVLLLSFLMSIFSVDPNFLERVNVYMSAFGFEPIFDITKLNPDTIKREPIMSKMWKFIVEYGERFSTTFVYVIFVTISLLVAVVLFGVLQSTGVMKIVLGGYVREAEFGGAFAGFLTTLIFLTTSYNRAIRVAKPLTITGNVFLLGRPVKGATVFVMGSDQNQKTTDSNGYFKIEVGTQNSWVVHASYRNKTTEITITRDKINEPVRLSLPDN